MKDFAKHSTSWRHPAQVASHWYQADPTQAEILRYRTSGNWWETIAEAGIALIVTRETEHVVMAIRADERGPDVSYVRLPHPSGLAVDHAKQVVYVASTRNPNQIFDFEPARAQSGGPDLGPELFDGRALLPVRSRLLPGSLYMHDLALIKGRLHASAVGQNAVIALDEGGGYKRVWWPHCIETLSGPIFRLNVLQLNSIAAGEELQDSFFTASTEKVSARKPGDLNFPVDGRGVIFSGRTRDVAVRGLTRPHSARLHAGNLWVNNSGYGTFGRCEDERLTVTAKLPGWTRGLCFAGSVAFVGTSRVIPGYQRYAPGLEVGSSVCGVHAVSIDSGQTLGSLVWPSGNQIFGIEWVSTDLASGFPFRPGKRADKKARNLFYSFATARTDGGLDATL